MVGVKRKFPLFFYLIFLSNQVIKGKKREVIKADMESMKPALILIGIISINFFVTSTSAKKYTRQELARDLLDLGVNQGDIAMWICIALHESGLDSDQINRRNTNGSWDHGLWQINDKWWVGRDRPGGGCGFSASEVRGDHLENAVKCVRHIFKEHQRIQGDGWAAWAVYSRKGYCKNDLSPYIEGCF